MPDAGDDPHHFDFDLDRGIRAQVVEKLETSPFLPLTKQAGPQASGIYALYFKGQLVYIGKASKGTTKSKRTLRARLTEHITKISGRKNITLADMKCRYLTFAVNGGCSQPNLRSSLTINRDGTKAGLAARCRVWAKSSLLRQMNKKTVASTLRSGGSSHADQE